MRGCGERRFQICEGIHQPIIFLRSIGVKTELIAADRQGIL